MAASFRVLYNSTRSAEARIIHRGILINALPAALMLNGDEWRFRRPGSIFTDITTDSDAFSTRMRILDEEAIRALAVQGVSRRVEFPVTTRVDYFPILMNGTSMAAPQDLLYPPFSPTEQALIGMPSISILGLSSLH